MKMQTIFLATFFACVFPIYSAQAANTVSLYPSSRNGTYVLKGEEIENVGAVNITISYDPSTLTNPRVSNGGLLSGALVVSNLETPGIVRIAGVHPSGINGSGTFSDLNFDPAGNSTGKIFLLSFSLSNINGTLLAAATPDQGSNNQPSSAEIPQTNGNNTSPSGSEVIYPQKTSGVISVQSASTISGSVQQVGVGSIPLLPDSRTTPENKRSPLLEQAPPPPLLESAEPPPTETTRQTTTPETAAVNKPVIRVAVNMNGVLARFRDYRGERKASAFLSFFEQSEQNSQKIFRQDPPVILADGTSMVKIFVHFPEADDKSPLFAFTGAKMISMKMEKGGWVFEALPNTGVHEATLTTLTSTAITEFPLTIAPRIDADLDKSGKVTEKDFEIYLKSLPLKKIAGVTAKDANQPSYIDDYIFTANYLVARKMSEGADKKPLPEKIASGLKQN